MAKCTAVSRKDSKGRVLRTGECQRKDGYYMYQYQDLNGKRRTIYSKDLPKLREKEKAVQRDQDDGIDGYSGARTTLNEVFDRYISGKLELKQSTRTNYIYLYDHYVRSSFGNRKIATIKYSDVKQFYYFLMTEKEFKPNSLESIHTIIHPTLTMAVRDNIIRNNPADGVMGEIKKSNAWEKAKRHALTIEQQTAFMKYTAESPVYSHWLPLFIVLLGTGCRIGEALGLRWQDLDFENRIISINHNLVYRIQDSGKCENHITTPKTKTGIRMIPMMEAVYQAFMDEQRQQMEMGFSTQIIDGYSGFVFTNRFGNVLIPTTVNRAIKRIYNAYNEEEKIRAKEEKRVPLLLPHFSCHHLRHTFCTRYCENETNLKVIQEIMGHADITTTMDIYAEATEEKKKESLAKLEIKVKIM